MKYTSNNQTNIAVTTAATIVSTYLEKFFTKKIERMSACLTAMDDNCRQKSFLYFRSKISPIFNLAPFSDRSLNKPLGYAGDFEMMNMIYRNEPLGQDLFGKAMHKYMINMSGGKAVRNRAYYLKEKIEKYAANGKSGKTLSVASGPAEEVQILFRTSKQDLSKIEFNFLDQDLSSLKYAQRQLLTVAKDTGIESKLCFHHINMKSVILQGMPEKNYDIIYSAGLFDYFNDSTAIRAAKSLYNSLSPNGILIIGNFDVGNPSRLFMELAWDWNLIYRSQAELKTLFSGIGTSVEVESEMENVNLFCVIHK